MSDSDEVAGPSVPKQIEFIKGPNNKNVLVRGHYKHFLHYTHKKDGMQVWKCTSNRSCKAKVKILRAKIISEDKHTCSSRKQSHITEDFKKECMDKMENSPVPIPKVYLNVKKSFIDKGIDLIEDLPSYESIKSTLYRRRNSNFNVSKTKFTDINEIEIPACFQDFLLYNSKEILIFCTEKARHIIKEKRIFFFDGTFKSCAAPFYQIYTMHVDISSTNEQTNIIPVLYSLLPNKQETTYDLLFQSIKECLPEWQPRKVFLDFEQGPINAIQKCFPEVVVKGCNFHFKKALMKKSKDLDISMPEDKDHVLRCAALAHLPITDVEDGWLVIMETAPPNEKITNFNNYFVDTWLNNSKLHYSIWNCEGERHRTTNLCESWHKTLNGELRNKPRFLELLFKIREQADYYDKYYCPTNNRKNKSIRRDEKIKVIENEYRLKSITIMEAINQYITI